MKSLVILHWVPQNSEILEESNEKGKRDGSK